MHSALLRDSGSHPRGCGQPRTQRPTCGWPHIRSSGTSRFQSVSDRADGVGGNHPSVAESQAAHSSHPQGESAGAQPKSGEAVEPQRVPLASSGARWLIAAAVLGSGIALLDATVVNVALPAIGRDLGGGLADQQWVLDGYLLTLSALLLSGGAAGDRYGRRRVFLVGLAVFTVASLACGLSPNIGWLIGARLVQGVGAAALVPGSLALIDAGIADDDRGRAVGIWAGMSGVTTALGPFIGGWLVDAASWRWVFLLNLPLAVAVVWIAARHIPESRDPTLRGRPDILGTAAVTVGLAGLIYALIEGPSRGWTFVI